MKRLRQLLWLYLVLLLIEGALRKWVVPALDAPLLIVRDPIVLLIYILAFRQGLSFRSVFFLPNFFLAIVTTLLSIVCGHGTLFITFFGLRTDFLQIPLIFLMPQILDRDDVVKMGRFILYAAIPIALLLVVQFESPPDSLLNKGAMGTHYGTVRPSGSFSFVTGIVSFFALVSSFVLFGCLERRRYAIWLLTLATMATLVSAGCSGSRSCLSSIAVVAVVAVLSVVVRGRGGLGLLVAAVLISLVFAALSTVPVFQKGTSQLLQRFEDAGAVEGNASGFAGRMASTMLNPVGDKAVIPLFGNGLGIGTNAASGLLKGFRESFTEAPENEWGRLIYESGFLFGGLLCLFRLALTATLAWSALRSFFRDNVLPLLIFAASALLILDGQWGVPTTLGFAIFGGGLTLAACRIPQDLEEEEDEYDEMEEDEFEPSEVHQEIDKPLSS